MPCCAANWPKRTSTWPWPCQVWGVEPACLGWFTIHQPKLPDTSRSRCQPGRVPSVLCMNYYGHLKGAFLELLVVIGFMSNQFAPKSLHSFLLASGAIVHVQITKMSLPFRRWASAAARHVGSRYQDPIFLLLFIACTGKTLACASEWMETIHVNFWYVTLLLHSFVNIGSVRMIKRQFLSSRSLQPREANT